MRRTDAPVVRLLLCFAAFAPLTTMAILEGTPVSCTGEGKEVTVPIVANNSCIKCFCEDSKVVCTNQRRCADTSNCYVIALPKPPDSCCEEICKGCEYGNRTYASDDSWSDPKDPCVVMECKAGIITRTKQLCQQPCKNAIRIPGQCCPVCQGCTIGRNTYQRGMTFPDPRDSCTTCTCQEDGNLQCARKACPVLNCPMRNMVQPEGSCCPVCQGKRSVFTVPGKCLYHPRGQVYSNGQMILEDTCGTCTCQGGTVLCDRLTCPRLACSGVDVLPPELGGGCCPRCRPAPRRCRDGGVNHQHGKSWFRDLCTKCYCNDGTMHCRREDCMSQAQHCPQKTHELQYVSGACCPQCIEKSATCVVFGDPHYKTFDGLLYTFQGSCGYVLARPCGGRREFSITVQNTPLPVPVAAVAGMPLAGDGSRPWAPTAGLTAATITASLTVRLGNLSVTLHKDLSVSVGGSPVLLPYLRLGRVSVVQRGYSLLVTTHLGVRLRWDGGGAYAELVVPRSYKGRMCGLCGNYNGAIDDEWTSRSRRGGDNGGGGRTFASAIEYGDSWRLPGSCHGVGSGVPHANGLGDFDDDRDDRSQSGKALANSIDDARDGVPSAVAAAASVAARGRFRHQQQLHVQLQRADYAVHQCSLLRGALVEPCLAARHQVDEAYGECVKRLRACPSGEQCLCGVLESLWKSCADRGSKLDLDLPPPCGSSAMR